ncbi:MAG: sensor histidine kinase [Frankia sp.]
MTTTRLTPTGRTTSVPAAIAWAPVSARTWRCLAYLVVNAVLGVCEFFLTFALLFSGTVFAVTFVGLPLICGAVWFGRLVGRAQRWLARAMLGSEVAGPDVFRAKKGLLGWLSSALADAPGWRGLAYVILRVPISAAGGLLTGLLWVAALVSFLNPVERLIFDPVTTDSHGVRHHSAIQLGNFYLDTWPKALLASAAGLLVVFIAPWPTRGLVALDQALIRWLLGPSRTSNRLRELEDSRSRAVDDSAATLRRIERDLHDGTQARLVALAMNIGRVKESLGTEADATPVDPAEMARARRLLEAAHGTAKDAIVELRELARGIHPPVLDSGLGNALATLAARSDIPVELHTLLDDRPTRAIETITYFCAAELLTNVARHSGASYAVLDVLQDGATLRLRVSDDGRGGARPTPGGGLSGLDERVRTVDGQLTVSSPEGGPTVVAVDLPMQS